jgi:outer membrane murein-binding lipoprotein Lpp
MLTINKFLSTIAYRSSRWLSLLLTASLALCSSSAYADDFCTDQAELATSIMQLRQMGAPVSKMIKAANNSSDERLRKLMVSYTETAYSRERYATKEYQHQAAVDFGTEVYNTCKQVRRTSDR